MLKYLETIEEKHLRSTVCIVGAGPAGITTARHLASRGIDVLLVEGGGARYESESQALFDSTTSGLPHAGIHTYRFRVLGGASTRWAGQALPLQDIDFKNRPWVPDSGWPLSSQELEPFLRKTENLLSIRPFVAPIELHWPAFLPGPPDFDRHLLTSVYSQFSPRPNFATEYKTELLGSQKITVLLHANVTELLLEPGGGAIDLALARNLTGKQVSIEASHFILCCGGIETARLLLSSDRRQAGGVGNQHDLVGRYFMDHPGFRVGEIGGGRARELFQPRKQQGIKYLPLIRASEDWQERGKHLNIGASVIFAGAQLPGVVAGKEVFTALRERQYGGEMKQALARAARHPLQLASAAQRYFLKGEPSQDLTSTMYLHISLEQRPNPESRITLSDQFDAVGQRRVNLNWRLSEDELSTASEFSLLLVEEVERLGLGSVRPRATSKSRS